MYPLETNARSAGKRVKEYAKDGFRDWAAAQRKDVAFETLMAAAKKHRKRPAAPKTAVEQIDERRDALKFAKERAQK